MALIDWREEFKIGIASVDYEHEHLISVINALFERLSGKHSVEKVRRRLGEIHALIEAHFALEEKIMRDTRYDNYAQHKADHNRLLDEIRDIMGEASDREDAGVHEGLGERIEAWFMTHFRTHDARFHALAPVTRAGPRGRMNSDGHLGAARQGRTRHM